MLVNGKCDAGCPLDENITIAMYNVFHYIANNEDCQFRFAELKHMMKYYVPEDKTVVRKLIGWYGSNIVITTKI